MNTAELLQAVEDAGCEFDCKVAGDLYKYLRRRDEVWIMLPKVFAWAEDDPSAPNNARLVANFNHTYTKTADVWHMGSVYSHLETVYDYANDERDRRIPVAIELVEGADPFAERERLTHPGAITMFLRGLVDEARAKTKEIRAVNVREAAKEYEV